MIGFSLEFKRWYVVLRGPKGRVYLAIGFAKHMPVMTPTGTYTMHDLMDNDVKYDTYRCPIDDSHSAILAEEWIDDVEDDEYDDKD